MVEHARHPHDDVRVDQELAARVLARAAELDARQDVSLRDLGDSAIEAGISPAAFHAAWSELQAHSTGPAVRGAAGDERWWRVGYRELSGNRYVRELWIAAASLMLAGTVAAALGRLFVL